MLLGLAALSAVAGGAGGCAEQGAREGALERPHDSREHVRLDKGWDFHLGTLPVNAATAQRVAGEKGGKSGEWQEVSLPHTWNNLDGQDGGNNYHMGDGWYRRVVQVTPAMAGKRVYVRFEGVDRNADVYMNGKLEGTHVGGNSAFCLDVTADVHPGPNLLAVRATNAHDGNTSPPIFRDATRTGPDYTFFGGIYRPVELIAANPVHISLTDYASPGVFISTPEVTDAQAKVHVRTVVENSGDRPMAAGSGLEIVIFDARGTAVARKRVPVEVQAGAAGTSGVKKTVEADLAIMNPHRWNGRADPYLYQVRVSVVGPEAGGSAEMLDSVTQPLGVRTYSIDPQKGFFLNGKSYPLHGVCRHQDRYNEGWALSEADHRQDMALIKEMGANTIRLAHYQQSDYFYSLCDREGMVVWAEVPNINYIGPSDEYNDNAGDQLRSLIRQSYNHPSIMFWSVGNEVRKPRETDPWATSHDPDPVAWFRMMSNLAHEEDPTRMSAVACRRDTPYRNSTDVYGLNIYYGWYESTLDNVDRYFSSLPPGWALTEYGAGGSIYFHSEHPVKMDHTEEFQCTFHEWNWAAIKKHPEIWGSYLWNMFDFAADDRFEGDRQGINDKGMVTYDRATKKDVFYFYKANWNPEPMVHLNSKRFKTRGLEQIEVKAYSNAPRVTLTVNGRAVGEKENDGNAVFVWPQVPLKKGENVVVATAQFANGKTVSDKATWIYQPGAPTEAYAAQDATMREVYQKGAPRSNYPKNPYTPPSRRPANGGGPASGPARSTISTTAPE
jgi:beta-galactosidase